MREISLFILVLISSLFFSCSKGDIDNIVGNWKSETPTTYPKFSFQSDKTFTWSTNSNNTNKGTYRAAGTNLFLSTNGREYKFKYSVDGNRLTLDRNEERWGDDLSIGYSLIKE